MASAAGGPPPPRDLLRQAHPVDARTRMQEDPGTVLPVCINDLQPTVESDGSVTLIGAYQSRYGTSDSIAINMPMGLLVELSHIVPTLTAGAAERALKQGNRLRAVAEAAGQKVDAPEYEPPTPAGVRDLRG